MQLFTLLDKPAQSLYSRKRAYLLANRINIDYKSLAEPKGSEKQRKNCIECAKTGYHSDLFNISFITKCPIHNTHLKTHCPSCGRDWKLPRSHKSEHASCKICGINLTLAELRVNGFIVKDPRYDLIKEMYDHIKSAQKYFQDTIDLNSEDYSLFPSIFFKDTSLSLGGSDTPIVVPSFNKAKKTISTLNWKTPVHEVSKSSFNIIKNNEPCYSIDQRNQIQEESLQRIKKQFYKGFNKINIGFPNCTESEHTDNYNCIARFMISYLEDIAKNYDIDRDYSRYENKVKGIEYGLKTTNNSNRLCIYNVIGDKYQSKELSQFIYENKLWQILVINFYRFICEHNLYGMLNKKVNIIGDLREMNAIHNEIPDIPYLIKKHGSKLDVYYPTCFESKSLIINKSEEAIFFDEKKNQIRRVKNLQQTNNFAPKRNFQLNLDF